MELTCQPLAHYGFWSDLKNILRKRVIDHCNTLTGKFPDSRGVDQMTSVKPLLARGGYGARDARRMDAHQAKWKHLSLLIFFLAHTKT